MFVYNEERRRPSGGGLVLYAEPKVSAKEWRIMLKRLLAEERNRSIRN